MWVLVFYLFFFNFFTLVFCFSSHFFFVFCFSLTHYCVSPVLYLNILNFATNELKYIFFWSSFRKSDQFTIYSSFYFAILLNKNLTLILKFTVRKYRARSTISNSLKFDCILFFFPPFFNFIFHHCFGLLGAGAAQTQTHSTNKSFDPPSNRI